MQQLYMDGHITYHRVDARHLDTEWVRDIRQGLGGRAGTGDPPGGRAQAHAQGAHGAIRPTSTQIGVPDKVKELAKSHQSVYQFIAYRAIAACMGPGYDTQVKLTLDNGATATLRKEADKGWRRLMPGSSPKDPNPEIWALKQGDAVDAVPGAAEIKARQPQPPDEPWTLEWMKKHGVGRPSTYAPTLKRLEVNKMVDKQSAGGKKTKYVMTTKGSLALDATDALAPALLEHTYTEMMEESLDRIATGEAQPGAAAALVEAGGQLAGERIPRHEPGADATPA